MRISHKLKIKIHNDLPHFRHKIASKLPGIKRKIAYHLRRKPDLKNNPRLKIVSVIILLLLSGSLLFLSTRIWPGFGDRLFSFISYILTLNNPVRIEYANTEEAFRYTDTPSFKLRTPQSNKDNIGQSFKGEYKNKGEEITANIVHKGYRYKYPADIKKTAAGEFDVSFEKPRSFVPGDYALEVSSKESIVYTRHITQDFSWGVLAINTQKSIYTPGELARLHMGVVDELGHTICDAELNLTITSPLGQITKLSSTDSTINQSGYCHGDSYVPVADYMADYKTGGTGFYKMELSAKTKNGYSRILKDQFEVRDSVPFDIERTSFPSRIYPPVDYPLLLTVKANQDFSGEVSDFSPIEFEIDCQKDIPLPDGIEKGSDKDYNVGRNYCTTNEFELSKKINWNVSLKKGQTAQLFYTIKFPPVSPEFYLMGPAKVYGRGYDSSDSRQTGMIFEEGRLWQIASDATVSTEQQINIISQTYSTTNQTDSPTDNSLGIIYYTETVYNPIPVTYFEADLKNSSDGITTATLYNSVGQPVANSSVSATGTNYQRVRSNRIYLAPGEYTARIKSSNLSTAYITAARIIAVQNTYSSYDKTETQIEVGSNETSTSTSMGSLAAPKIYQYDDVLWSPRPTAYFEATIKGINASTNVDNAANSPTCATDTGDAGLVDWSTVTNAEDNTDGDAYATASLDGTTTEYMRCSSFDFAIDSGATIIGIVVNIERKAGQAGEHLDSEVKLIDETAAIGTEDRATATTYTTSDVVESHGSSTDLWGGSSSGAWTPAKINDADFGVAFKATDNSSAGAAEIDSVDAITVTVYYTLPATAYAELYNRTDQTIVTNSAISTSSLNWSRVRGASALSTNWDTTNDDQYEVRIRSDNVSGAIGISNAKIILQQSGSNITKLETYHNYINNQQTQSRAGSNIGTFASTNQAQLPIALDGHNSFTSTIGASTYLYALLGREDGSTNRSTVYKSTLSGANGDVGTFSTSSQAQFPASLRQQRTKTHTIGSSTYVYVVGGFNQAGTRQSTVYKSTINSTTGDLGTFATTTQNQLKTIFADAADITTSNISGSDYIYLVGGKNSTTATSAVYKATINSTGDISTAFDTTSQAQLASILHSLSVEKATIGPSTYIYVMGGTNGTTNVSTVYKAALNNSGDISSFLTTNQAQLPKIYSAQETVVTTIGSSTYMFLMGGDDNGPFSSALFKATINSSNGDIGAFSKANQSQLPYAVQYFSLGDAAIKGSSYLYILAGDIGVNNSAVYKAQVTNDSDAFGFTNLYDPNNWQGGTFTYYNEATLKPTQLGTAGYVRLTPGQLAAASSTGANGNGNITGTFSTTSQAQLPTAIQNQAATTVRTGGINYLYVISGRPNGTCCSSTVYKAEIDDNSGNVGAFDTTGQGQLPNRVREHAALSHTNGSGSYIYVVGGYFNTSTYFSTVYKANVNSLTGDVGTFSTTSQAQMGSAHSDNMAAAIATINSSDYFYISGGRNNTVRLSTVYKATIDASGNITGTFGTASQAQLPEVRFGHSMDTATIGPSTYMYVIGGYNASASQTTIYKSVMDTSGNAVSFLTTNQVQLPIGTAVHKTLLSTVGSSTYIYVMGGDNDGPFSSTVYKAVLDSGDGDVVSISSTSQSQLPYAVQFFAIAKATAGPSTYFYVMAGDDGNNISTVYKAAIDHGIFELNRSSSFSPDSDPGRIGTFATTSQSQLTDISPGNNSITANVSGVNYLYRLGGGLNAVGRSIIDSAGNTSTFSSTGQSWLNFPFSKFSAHNFMNTLNTNFIFTIGGRYGIAAPSSDAITFATTSQAQLPTVTLNNATTTRMFGASTYIYAIGGNTGSTVYKATLNSTNGNVGTFATTSQAQLPPTSSQGLSTHFQTIGSSTYLYTIGGQSSSYNSTVYKSIMNHDNGNVGTFLTTSQSQLPIQSMGHGAALQTIGSSTYVYITGGFDATTTFSTVFKATIDSGNGNVGTFVTSSQAQLPVGLRLSSDAVATFGSSTYLYVTGGLNSSFANTSTVYRAALNPTTGDVGTFLTTSQTQLPTTHQGHSINIQSVGISSYMYVIGGLDSSFKSTVYKAPIDPATGNVGTFATTSQGQLTDRRYKISSAIQAIGASTYIYATGGTPDNINGASTVYKSAIDSAGISDMVLRSQIDTSANTGHFSSGGQAQLPQNLSNHSSTIISKPDNYLYVLGGCNNFACAASDSVSTVYKSTIDIPASIGPFATTSQAQLLEQLSDVPVALATFGASTYLYVMPDFSTTVYRATINSTTTNMGTFATTSQAQLLSTVWNQSAHIKNFGSSTYLYLIGGRDGSSALISTVYRSTINTTNGNLGTFATTSQAQLPDRVSEHSSNVVSIGPSTYIYVLGGSLTGSTVYKATFNFTNGNLDAFATTSQGQLPETSSDHESEVVTIGQSTYIYVIAGGSGSSVYKAAIDPSNGNVGTFMTTSQAQLLKTGNSFATASQTVGNSSYIYVIGGTFGGKSSTLYRSVLNSNTGDAGAFSTTNQLQLQVTMDQFSGVTYTSGSTYIYLIGNVNGSGVTQSSLYKAALDLSPNIATFATTSQGQLPQGIRSQSAVSFSIPNGTTYVYSLGGINSSDVVTSTIYRATVGSSGNLGAFSTTDQAQLPQSIHSQNVLLTNIGGAGVMYVVGGCTTATCSSSNISTVYRAQINSTSGNVGTFATTGMGQIPKQLNSLSSVKINEGQSSYMYLIGGDSSGTGQSSVYRSTISASDYDAEVQNAIVSNSWLVVTAELPINTNSQVKITGGTVIRGGTKIGR